MPKEVSVFVDTDYGGCRRTRRSTNGGLIKFGSHMIKSWSTTQTVVALSSGEAEYYGVTKGTCEAIGIVGLIEDLTGMRMSIKLATDSSAAKGIATRKGVGKVKHLETRTLWVQDQVERGRVRIQKVHGNSNPAQILTKYLSGNKLRDLLTRFPAEFREGRHQLTPMI